jgi:hypothetical protein
VLESLNKCGRERKSETEREREKKHVWLLFRLKHFKVESILFPLRF